MNEELYNLNKECAKTHGYKVISSPYGHVPLKGKWSGKIHKKEKDAWLQIFAELGYPPVTSGFGLDEIKPEDGNEEW